MADHIEPVESGSLRPTQIDAVRVEGAGVRRGWAIRKHRLVGTLAEIMTTNVERYWNQYLMSRPEGQEQPSRYVECFAFGFTPADAHEIAQLVLSGTKTATGSVLWSYHADQKPLPTVGDLWIVMAGSDVPVCIIQTTEIRIIPFEEVTADYAWDGGEEDRSLASWREIYWEYIDRECHRLGYEPNTKVPLVMERFRVVYADPLQ